MNKVFFTSDLHFHHKKIVEYTNRGVDTTQEHHDEWLIDLWNSQVGKNDVVYKLGDFAFNRRKLVEWQTLTNRLNGRIVHIKGNHDDRKCLKQLGHEWYDLKGVSLNIGGDRKQYAVMCHFPLAVWDKSHHGSWMLHGHSHGSYKPEMGKILDVRLDSAYNVLGEHRFFTLDDITNYMATRQTAFDDHHRESTLQ